MNTLELAEKRLLPDWLIRIGIRNLLRQRLRQEAERQASDVARLVAQLQSSPITIETDAANQQHYEVPAAFYQRVLGRRLKYSCGYWPDAETTLDQSEEAMLRLTCERAGLADGMDVLELGCGWGSLTLWMAEQFPNARILAVSNSNSQRQFIQQRAQQSGLANVEVTTCDVAKFDTNRRFDRVVSVEMFEHARNYQQLMRNIAGWLTPAGKLFVHIFCHRELAYVFETEGATNWMGRHFFTGGIMPSQSLLHHFQDDLRLESQWNVSGLHYARTSEAWLQRSDENRKEIQRIFARDLGRREAAVQLQRWRMFFMACAELFRYDSGRQWFVEHYLFAKDLAASGRVQ